MVWEDGGVTRLLPDPFRSDQLTKTNVGWVDAGGFGSVDWGRKGVISLLITPSLFMSLYNSRTRKELI